MPKEKDRYFKLLSEYKDVLAWSYKEIPRLDATIEVYDLSIKGVPPKKQPQWHFCLDLTSEIEKEVNKLIDAMFMYAVKYPT